MKQYFFILSCLFPWLLMAQDDAKEKKFGVSFSGYVKNEIFYDTRQSQVSREGCAILYPLGKSPDKNGKDVNAKSSFNMLALTTRLKGDITGPDAFGAKTSGFFETDFFGASESDINGLRLRHALVKLNWKSTELLFGQYWHPLMVNNCFPDVVSYATGAPFQPFSRNPQVRLTQKFCKMKVILAAIAQRDYASPAGSLSLRNAAIPNMNLQIQYESKNEAGNEFLAGAGCDFKMLQPRLKTDSLYKTNKTVKGISAIGYIKYKTSKITCKLEGVYGQNLYDLMMLGGYAYRYTQDEKSIATNDFDYTSLDNLSLWGEFQTNGEKFQVGIFGGYTKNMASLKNINAWESSSSFFTRGRDIAYIYRIAPRIIFNSGKVRLAGEFEYTTAAYGKEINSLGQVSNTSNVSNLRLLFSVYYFF